MKCKNSIWHRRVIYFLEHYSLHKRSKNCPWKSNQWKNCWSSWSFHCMVHSHRTVQKGFRMVGQSCRIIIQKALEWAAVFNKCCAIQWSWFLNWSDLELRIWCQVLWYLCPHRILNQSGQFQPSWLGLYWVVCVWVIRYVCCCWISSSYKSHRS